MFSGFESVRRRLGTVSWKLIMEKMLYDAAVENNVSTLQQLLGEDPLVLRKASLNCQDMNPLHVAVMLGNDEFAKEVVRVSPDMCWAVDRFGRIPLHLAVITGNLPVLKKLIEARPLAAREKTEGGGNVLHLCVKHERQEALEFLVDTIKDKDFANQKDDKGMTILHLAICGNQTEIIKYLLKKEIVDVNAKNAIGNTASDLFQENNNFNSEIAPALEEARARADRSLNEDSKWLSEKRGTLMIVASLVAAMAFQAAINPTGGVWQDDSDSSKTPPHRAGKSVMAYRQHGEYYNYRYFVRTNTMAFLSSLSVILLLISGLPFRRKFFWWALTVTMWITITSIALTYGVSILMITPSSRDGIKVIQKGVMVWCGVMSLLLLVVANAMRSINRWLRRRFGINVLKFLTSRWQSACGKKSYGEQGSCQMC